MPTKTPITMVQLLDTHGVALVLVALMLPLLFTYFWKVIQQKSLFERLFDAQNKVLEQLAHKLDKVKDDLLVIKTTIRGEFRVKGRTDDEE